MKVKEFLGLVLIITSAVLNITMPPGWDSLLLQIAILAPGIFLAFRGQGERHQQTMQEIQESAKRHAEWRAMWRTRQEARQQEGLHLVRGRKEAVRRRALEVEASEEAVD